MLNRDKLVKTYNEGFSITECADLFDTPKSTIRHYIKTYGKLRTRAEGVRIAAKKGKIGEKLRGKKRIFSESHKQSIKKSRQLWSAQNSRGVSLKLDGYIEITIGEHKYRHLHVVVMERRLGRRLLPDEIVHHIDGDKMNNDISNLALMTRSGHARLHRYEDKLSGNLRERDNHGRFC